MAFCLGIFANVEIKICNPLAISADRRCAVAAFDANHTTGKIVIYDLATGKMIKQWLRSDGWWGPVALSEDGKRALVGKAAKRAGSWAYQYLALCNVETGEEIWASEPNILSGRFMPGEHHVLAQGSNATWKKLEAATGRALRTFTTDFGTVLNEKGQPTRYGIVDALSSDTRIYLAIMGGNVGPGVYAPERSFLTVKVWWLGRRAQLVNNWLDGTRPHGH